LARKSKGLRHREQPKISEEGIRPSRVIAKAVTLRGTMKLSAQDRSQTATDKAVDGREGVAVGMLEIAEPATQEWIDRGNDVRDRVTPVTPGLGPDFIPQSREAFLAHPTLARLEPVAQKLEPMTRQPAIAGSAGGISPPAAHRTVRKPLDLHGSSQPFFRHLAMTDRRGR
jgi:hypothetical protein